MSSLDALLIDLRLAVQSALPGIDVAALEPLADKGLAHWHVRMIGTGLLARIPKQSQMELEAEQNLAYQQACFARAAASGHTPRVHEVLRPSAALPRGALIVDEIAGRSPRLPEDVPAIARALAAIHGLDLTPPPLRPPLLDATDPLADLLDEVRSNAEYLDAARLDQAARGMIESELAAFAHRVAAPERPPKALIAFDAHPGNFVITPDGRAILVDLEKARYAYPPLDLAHATLYTSTTWDVDSVSVLTIEEIAAVYRAWAAAMGESAASWRHWHTPLRRAMWLWSVTWCAKWRALSADSARGSGDGEDWSAEHSKAELVAHVRDRVDCYLSTAIVKRMADEFATLDGILHL